MQVTVRFYSYFKDLTGCAQATEILSDVKTLGDLFETLAVRFPKLAGLPKSVLMAVAVK